MTSITNNFNGQAIAANQNLELSALPGLTWFHGYFLIWMWLSVSNDANEAKKKLETRKQWAKAHARDLAKAKKRAKHGSFGQKPNPVPPKVHAPAFR